MRRLVLLPLPWRELWVVVAERVVLRGGEVVHGGWSDVLDRGLRELIWVETCSWLMAEPAMVVLRAPSPS
jgi:hypothetical protein